MFLRPMFPIRSVFLVIVLATQHDLESANHDWRSSGMAWIEMWSCGIGWGGYKNKQYLRNRFYFIQFSADGPRHHSQHVDCVSADGPIAVSRFDLVSFCC